MRETFENPAARIRHESHRQAYEILKLLPLRPKVRRECLLMFLMTMSDENMLFVPGTDEVLKFAIFRED